MKERGMDTPKEETKTKKSEAEEEKVRRDLGRLAQDIHFPEAVVLGVLVHTHLHGADRMPGNVLSILQMPHFT